jgi:hypothetical protein
VSEADSQALEREWSSLSVPFTLLGKVTSSERLEVTAPGAPGQAKGQGSFSLEISELRRAWLKEGYWE